MPSESYFAQYPSLQEEKLALDELQDALRSEDWPRACKAIGAISEMVALARYGESQKTKPKNVHLAIDFITNNKLIPRPLGYKMHIIRELRNVASHPKDPNRLPYTITKEDAKMAEQILIDLLSWMRGDKLRENWNEIVSTFEAGERALDVTTWPIDSRVHRFEVVNQLYSALEQAAYLKLY